MMSPQAKREYMATIYKRYHNIQNRLEKSLILDEFVKTYECHRKSAIRLLNSPPKEKSPRNPRQSPYDDKLLIAILEAIWKSSSYLCGQRLKATIKLWLPAARKQFNITPAYEKLLLSMSSATIDRKLKDKKAYYRKRIYGTTKPGSLLKHQIPIKTESWDVNEPGFLEIDLVAHCGDCAEGDFANTLDVTDILTGWVERRCFIGKGQEAVREALDDIRRNLPFKLLGIDSDGGSEFINNHLLKYCRTEPKIEFTRSRPYKKDDNAHIEQKNWTHVRKLIGYGRYETQEAVAAINDLYRNELRLFQNLFQPSVKLISKTRVGSKIKRIYDKPKTPLERVLESGKAYSCKESELKALMLNIDPFKLSRIVDEKLSRIWEMRSKAPKPYWIKRTMPAKYEEGDYLALKPAFCGTEKYQDILRKERVLETW